LITRFAFPTNVLFGPGAVGEIGALVKGSGGTVALIVSDPGVVGAGLVAPVQRSLEAAGLFSVLHDGVAPNPLEENVETGAALFRQEGCDFVIGVGGGSALDAAKAIRLRITHSRPLIDYDDNAGGGELIRSDMPRMIAVPTTAGTGSEVGRSAVIICRANQRKTVIFSPHLMPSYAVCDPEMTVGMPPPITAATGMDALTHNIEAFLSTPYHPLADAIALYGARLCAENLARAVESGQDREARANMMMAAMMGATAFQKGLGVTHSLAHPLSSVAGIHHGLANAILLPHVLEFNASACQSRYRDLSRTLNVPDASGALSEWVRELNRKIGIPAALGEVGVGRDMIAAMVPKAMEDGCHLNNPRPCSAEDMRALYQAAF